MTRLLLLLMLALAPSAATAGTRAVYLDGFGFRRVILIADNGDMDIELRTGQHLIVKGGRSFIVEDRLTGPVVSPLEELDNTASAIAAARRRQPPSAEAQAALDAITAEIEAAGAEATAEAGRISNADVAESDAAEGPPLRRRDGMTVNGRTGRGYYARSGPGGRDERLFVVISDDPAFAQVGLAFRLGLAAEDRFEQIRSNIPAFAGFTPAMIRILETGTPLQLFDDRLREISQVAIPAIALPAEPETAAALRTRLAADSAMEYGPLPPEWNASHAIFTGGRLYLVDGRHRLVSLAEGETTLTSHDPGEPVLDACVQGGDVLALTGPPEEAPAWTLRRLHAGRWQTERTVARAGDVPLALSCTADGPFLLTGTRFINLRPAQPEILPLRGRPVGALVGTVVHVTPQAVFVGLNSGEWGGGLRRIDRRTGQIETIARNATGGLCDGPLNTDCDPVQGLATIPWRRDCVAAAIGLIHMGGHGRLTMVCPGRIEQLYAATEGEFEDPARSRRAAAGGFGSIAFFGLTAAGDSLLAVGHNGLHRLAAGGTATHIPLPRFVRVEGLLVSFALPDVVLVITGINGRASLSGAVPIMAVRQ